MPNPRLGLRVKYCENVATYEQIAKGDVSRKVREAHADGWFVMVRYGGQWRALMQLRFARERDAIRAAWALTQAGLDSITALKAADPLAVLEIATRYLQW